MQQIQNYKDKWFDFIDYKPHTGQKLLHNPPQGDYHPKYNPEGARFIIACCGKRFGKSVSASKEIEVVLTQPNTVSWVVAPSYSTSEKIFSLVYQDLVVHKGYKPNKYSAKDQYLEFDWDGGKSILCGKSAEHPGGLIGEGCDLIVIDEASKVPNLKKIFEMYLRPTLSDKKGKIIFISTPDGYGYFYELYLRGQSGKNWHSFNAPSWINEYSFPLGKDDPDLIEARSTLSKEIYQQEYGAAFTALSGRVYEDFDRNENVGDYDYDYTLPTFLALDFGYRKPAALWVQVKRINGIFHLYIIDEIIHQTNLKTTDFIELIKKRKYNINQVYGDPASYQVQSAIGMGEADLFYKYTGWRIHALRDKASRSITGGISHVRSFILSQEGTRRLHIDRSCIGIVEDLESYRYPEEKEFKDLKELPIKDGHSDHGCDALRYFCVSHFPIKNHKIKIGAR